jgi:hypothetical protein
MSEELFTVTVTALHGRESADHAARFLAMVFKNRSLEEIEDALTTLPLLITSDVSRAAADTLRKHLEARGATVLIESYPVSFATPTSGDGRVAPRAPAAPAQSATPTASETSYAFARPGRRDLIHCR